MELYHVHENHPSMLLVLFRTWGRHAFQPPVAEMSITTANTDLDDPDKKKKKKKAHAKTYLFIRFPDEQNPTWKTDSGKHFFPTCFTHGKKN